MRFRTIQRMAAVAAALTAAAAIGGGTTTATAGTASPALPDAPAEPPVAAPAAQAGPASWTRSNPGGGGALMAVGASRSGIIVVGSDLSGAYVSRDRGASFDPVGEPNGVSDTGINAVGFDTQNGDIFYLGGYHNLWRTADGGRTFANVLPDLGVSAIAFSASNPDIGYAAVPYWLSDSATQPRVYKTTDRGLHWARIDTSGTGRFPVLTPPYSLRLIKLLVNPANPNVVFALSGEERFGCSSPRLYRSIDGGVKWTLVSSTRQVRDVTIDPVTPSRMYYTTYGTYYPNSEPWGQHGDGGGCFKEVQYAGRLYTSTDSGATWTAVTTTYPRCPMIEGITVAAQKKCLVTGQLWVDADDQHALRLYDPTNQVNDSTTNRPSGMWESLDRGRTWTRVSLPEAWDMGIMTGEAFSRGTMGGNESHTIGYDLSDPDAMFMVNWTSMYTTRDDGRTGSSTQSQRIGTDTWRSTGLDNIVGTELVISKARPTDIYLGLYDVGCWKSADSGGSWARCNSPAHGAGIGSLGGNVMSIATDPTRPDVVWMVESPTNSMSDGAGGGDLPRYLLRSNDGGRTWAESMTGLPQTLPGDTSGYHSASPGPRMMSGLSIDPRSPATARIMYVVADGDVYRSSDDGVSWSKVLDCDCWTSTPHPYLPANVYAGGRDGLWISNQRGVAGSWRKLMAPPVPYTGPGRSTPFSADYYEGWSGVISITPDLSNGDVYVGMFGGRQADGSVPAGAGLYRMTVVGSSITKLTLPSFTGPSVDPNAYLRDVAIAPGVDRAHPIIYVTSSTSDCCGANRGYPVAGVVRSTDGGVTWTRVNQGMAWSLAYQIALDPTDPNHVWMMSPGTGLQHRGF